MVELKRMRRAAAIGSACALVALAAVSATKPHGAPGSDPPAGGAGDWTRTTGGYLAPSELPDAARMLGPPPAEGSGTKSGDVATFRSTRALQGTPRWSLASRDNEFGAAAMMADYSCALGVELSPTDAPALFHLLSRLVVDSLSTERAAKEVYKRPRPFVEIGGPICIVPTPSFRASYSYPSGHSTFSWAAAMVLEQVAPDRSGEILSRARSYGESRVVCGVHYASDVQAGRMTASALFAVLQNSPAFKADLARAEHELARIRGANRSPPEPGRCSAEVEASTHPIW